MKLNLRMGRGAFGALFSFASLCAIAAMAFGPSYFEREPALRTQTAEAALAPREAAANEAAETPVARTQGAAVSRADASAVAALNLDPTNVAAPVISRSGPPLQCAIYARQRTGVSLAGAARLWWSQAEGRYRRSHTPEVGAVMAMGGTPSGHVAVVSRVINPREILIDHANWLGGGEIITGALAMDVSPNNDWTQVRVWHPPTNSLGLRPYPVSGFIHPADA
ncbi:MAG: CHAP domain-containing protein [Hyphomonadaceae bacterium]